MNPADSASSVSGGALEQISKIPSRSQSYNGMI
jgi:hypothetical protein